MSSNLAGRANSFCSIMVCAAVCKDRKLPSFDGGLNPKQIKQGVKNVIVCHGLARLLTGAARFDGESLLEPG